MEHIGSGWQFDAYAEGDRVVKVPTGPLTMASRVVRSYPRLILSPWTLSQKVGSLLESRAGVLAELDRREFDRDLVANFRREDGTFLQDRVITIGDALQAGHDPMDLIERYLDSVVRTWRAGFAETSFNFTVNHGLNRTGQVVVLDVGELTFDRQEASDLMDERLWHRAFSTRVLAPAHADYLVRRMDTWARQNRLAGEWRDARYVRVRPGAPDREASRSEAARRLTLAATLAETQRK